MINLKIHNIPFYLTMVALFLLIATHLLSFNFFFYFQIVTLIITIPFIMPLKRYPENLLFFVVFWLMITLFHFIFKHNTFVFGIMQSFFYGICFYTILKYNTNKIEPRELLTNIYKIYGVLLITLIAEFIMNVIGKESLLLDLFSNPNAGKSYQYLTSKITIQIPGFSIRSLNTVFLGPQSASILTLVCLIIYNPFDKLLYTNLRIKFLISVVLYLVCYTMTSNLILFIVITYLILFSKYSNLNKVGVKAVTIPLITLNFSAIFIVMFYGFQESQGQWLYILKWTQPLHDMLDLSVKEFLLGIPSDVSTSKYTWSHEFGLIQMIYIYGIAPVIFFLSLAIFIFIQLNKYKSFALIQTLSTYRDLYRSTRLSVIVIIVFIFSLIHYASIFSGGFYQLMGFHIAICFYCFDRMKYLALRYKEKMNHSSLHVAI